VLFSIVTFNDLIQVEGLMVDNSKGTFSIVVGNKPRQSIMSSGCGGSWQNSRTRLAVTLLDVGQVLAKLKLVRLECVESLIHNTLEHGNLTALCFAPMLKKVWSRSLIQEINRNAASTLRHLTVNFRWAFASELRPFGHCFVPGETINDHL